MKRKIIQSFLAVFLLSSLGVVFAYIHVKNTNDTLGRIINLHKIETLRQQLLKSIQKVQTDLYAVNTEFGVKQVDNLIDDVEKLEQAALHCTTCHHTPEITSQLEKIQQLTGEYQKTLSDFKAAPTDSEAASKAKFAAVGIGNRLVLKTEEVSLLASTRLKAVTTDATHMASRVTRILAATMLLEFILGITLAVYLTRAITRPIDALLEATRIITTGRLGHRLEYNDSTEFGELTAHFNDMSGSLRDSYTVLEREIAERKKSEEALLKSDERYALAAQGSNDGLWDWDLSSNAIYFSSRWKSMLGYRDDEIGNQPEEWLGRIHPDDRNEIEIKIAAHISGRDSHFEHEFRIMHLDWKYRWMLARGLAVRNESGQVSRMAGSMTDITSRKSAAELLAYNAFHDSLTALPNRSLFLERLQHVIASSARHDEPRYAVLFLDLDRFKIVNDSLGHLIGDRLLINVGLKLVECIRPGDTVARLGGDEFSILLEDISELKDAIDIVDRIHQKLSAPFIIEQHEVFAGVSVGIALGSKSYDRGEQVLRDADIAMYEAKKHGRGCYEIFDANMHASILDRIRLESELSGILVHNQLSMVYQPIIDLNTKRLSGFEALARWNHPTRGTLYPTEFIPVAEQTGFIIKIGEWVLREACRELADLQKRFPSEPPLKMSINISGKQFAQENLADLVAEILNNSGVAPQSLAIEITESMLMENIDVAVSTMHRLRSMGVDIHIDDFGTGYSSLSYLQSLPIDAIKIDRSFINKLNTEGENQEIILAIMSLAKSLNFDVIAEGVELDHQMEQMKGLKCRLGQGYLFSKPIDSDDLDAWMKSQNRE